MLLDLFSRLSVWSISISEVRIVKVWDRNSCVMYMVMVCDGNRLVIFMCLFFYVGGWVGGW